MATGELYTKNRISIMKRIVDLINFNIAIHGAPKLINKDSLEENFFYDNIREHIIQYAIQYFYEDPEKWSVPAKNYFVRICLAYYVSNKFNIKFLSAMDDNDILPYDDQISPRYSIDPDTYDSIINTISIDRLEELIGYQKTLNVFSYLYNDIMRPITIGYNSMGQDFFDLISFKRNHIIEFYFSLFHRMRQQRIDFNTELEELSSCDMYGIPGNLLLNTPYENDNWEKLIQEVKNKIPLRSVSILTLDVARRIRDKYPELLIHISTHGSTDLTADDYTHGYIDVMNVAEPFYLKQKEAIRVARENGIQIKYIVNRGCVVNKSENMSSLFGQEIHCNNFTSIDRDNGPQVECEHVCDHLIQKHPWFQLAKVDLVKEILVFNHDIDIVKLSTRDNSLDEVKLLLDYWTSYKPTERIIDFKISDYQTFIQWVRYKAVECCGNCRTCMYCKRIFSDFIYEE